MKRLETCLKFQGTEESYDAVIMQMYSLFRTQYDKVESDVWDDMERESAKVSLNDLTEMLVPVYSQDLTPEDLEELIKFYETPVGNKFAKNAPLIIQESMQIGQRWGIKLGRILRKRRKKRILKDPWKRLKHVLFVFSRFSINYI